MRFLERRQRAQEGSTRAPLQDALSEVAARGMRWVDHFNYFGPDRRSGAFSYFFLERRRPTSAGPPPPLAAALRQLRVRSLEACDAEGREALRDRVTATAILANAQGHAGIGDLLMDLAAKLDGAEGSESPEAMLQWCVLRAEAMLDE